MDILQSKKWLRGYAKKIREDLPVSLRQKKDQKIFKKLINIPQFKKAKTVALFLSFGTEVSTQSIIHWCWKNKKRIVLPVCREGFEHVYFNQYLKGDQLYTTKFGIQEVIGDKPKIRTADIQLFIVPGLLFDVHRHRLGYGGGVYDRILEKSPQTDSIGVFYSEQQVSSLPREKHDIPLKMIVTDVNSFT